MTSLVHGRITKISYRPGIPGRGTRLRGYEATWVRGYILLRQPLNQSKRGLVKQGRSLEHFYTFGTQSET